MWLSTGFWISEWIDHLYTRLGSTSNYSATANPHNSPQHPLSLFQPAVSSLAVPWQRLLTVEFLLFHALKPSLHRLPAQDSLGRFSCLSYNCSARTTQKRPVSNSTSIVACRFVAPGTCLSSRCLVYPLISWSLHSNCCTRYMCPEHI
jgi:hypothetical protein